MFVPQIARSSVRPEARRARTDVSEAPTLTPNYGLRDVELSAAQHRIRGVKRRHGALVGPAVTHGMDRRCAARTLSLANATVNRRNGSDAE